ncbi:hypothetical protein TGARI_312875 [Toxoplasma gondii ARI]|uniref:Uncharacterized protein n=1 Tax=Toxoplasma gondii ARI TaxID=1074872 RepID=A0A139Y8Q4_TOXGO|nr:hypothetical protein TGARI_312875 [Toxoplasma gondii ARI]
MPPLWTRARPDFQARQWPARKGACTEGPSASRENGRPPRLRSASPCTHHCATAWKRSSRFGNAGEKQADPAFRTSGPPFQVPDASACPPPPQRFLPPSACSVLPPSRLPGCALPLRPGWQETGCAGPASGSPPQRPSLPEDVSAASRHSARRCGGRRSSSDRKTAPTQPGLGVLGVCTPGVQTPEWGGGGRTGRQTEFRTLQTAVVQSRGTAEQSRDSFRALSVQTILHECNLDLDGQAWWMQASPRSAFERSTLHKQGSTSVQVDGDFRGSLPPTSPASPLLYSDQTASPSCGTQSFPVLSYLSHPPLPNELALSDFPFLRHQGSSQSGDTLQYHVHPETLLHEAESTRTWASPLIHCMHCRTPPSSLHHSLSPSARASPGSHVSSVSSCPPVSPLNPPSSAKSLRSPPPAAEASSVLGTPSGEPRPPPPHLLPPPPLQLSRHLDSPEAARSRSALSSSSFALALAAASSLSSSLLLPLSPAGTKGSGSPSFPAVRSSAALDRETSAPLSGASGAVFADPHCPSRKARGVPSKRPASSPFRQKRELRVDSRDEKEGEGDANRVTCQPSRFDSLRSSVHGEKSKLAQAELHNNYVSIQSRRARERPGEDSRRGFSSLVTDEESSCACVSRSHTSRHDEREGDPRHPAVFDGASEANRGAREDNPPFSLPTLGLPTLEQRRKRVGERLRLDVPAPSVSKLARESATGTEGDKSGVVSSLRLPRSFEHREESCEREKDSAGLSCARGCPCAPIASLPRGRRHQSAEQTADSSHPLRCLESVSIFAPERGSVHAKPGQSRIAPGGRPREGSEANEGPPSDCVRCHIVPIGYEGEADSIQGRRSIDEPSCRGPLPLLSPALPDVPGRDGGGADGEGNREPRRPLRRARQDAETFFSSLRGSSREVRGGVARRMRRTQRLSPREEETVPRGVLRRFGGPGRCLEKSERAKKGEKKGDTRQSWTEEKEDKKEMWRVEKRGREQMRQSPPSVSTGCPRDQELPEEKEMREKPAHRSSQGRSEAGQERCSKEKGRQLFDPFARFDIHKHTEAEDVGDGEDPGRSRDKPADTVFLQTVNEATGHTHTCGGVWRANAPSAVFSGAHNEEPRVALSAQTSRSSLKSKQRQVVAQRLRRDAETPCGSSGEDACSAFLRLAVGHSGRGERNEHGERDERGRKSETGSEDLTASAFSQGPSSFVSSLSNEALCTAELTRNTVDPRKALPLSASAAWPLSPSVSGVEARSSPSKPGDESDAQLASYAFADCLELFEHPLLWGVSSQRADASPRFDLTASRSRSRGSDRGDSFDAERERGTSCRLLRRTRVSVSASFWGCVEETAETGKEAFAGTKENRDQGDMGDEGAAEGARREEVEYPSLASAVERRMSIHERREGWSQINPSGGLVYCVRKTGDKTRGQRCENCAAFASPVAEDFDVSEGRREVERRDQGNEDACLRTLAGARNSQRDLEELLKVLGLSECIGRFGDSPRSKRRRARRKKLSAGETAASIRESRKDKREFFDWWVQEERSGQTETMRPESTESSFTGVDAHPSTEMARYEGRSIQREGSGARKRSFSPSPSSSSSSGIDLLSPLGKWVAAERQSENDEETENKAQDEKDEQEKEDEKDEQENTEGVSGFAERSGSDICHSLHSSACSSPRSEVMYPVLRTRKSTFTESLSSANAAVPGDSRGHVAYVAWWPTAHEHLLSVFAETNVSPGTLGVGLYAEKRGTTQGVTPEAVQTEILRKQLATLRLNGIQYVLRSGSGLACFVGFFTEAHRDAFLSYYGSTEAVGSLNQPPKWLCDICLACVLALSSLSASLEAFPRAGADRTDKRSRAPASPFRVPARALWPSEALPHATAVARRAWRGLRRGGFEDVIMAPAALASDDAALVTPGGLPVEDARGTGVTLAPPCLGVFLSWLPFSLWEGGQRQAAGVLNERLQRLLHFKSRRLQFLPSGGAQLEFDSPAYATEFLKHYGGPADCLRTQRFIDHFFPTLNLFVNPTERLTASLSIFQLASYPLLSALPCLAAIPEDPLLCMQTDRSRLAPSRCSDEERVTEENAVGAQPLEATERERGRFQCKPEVSSGIPTACATAITPRREKARQATRRLGAWEENKASNINEEVPRTPQLRGGEDQRAERCGATETLEARNRRRKGRRGEKRPRTRGDDKHDTDGSAAQKRHTKEESSDVESFGDSGRGGDRGNRKPTDKTPAGHTEASARYTRQSSFSSSGERVYPRSGKGVFSSFSSSSLSSSSSVSASAASSSSSSLSASSFSFSGLPSRAASPSLLSRPASPGGEWWGQPAGRGEETVPFSSSSLGSDVAVRAETKASKAPHVHPPGSRKRQSFSSRRFFSRDTRRGMNRASSPPVPIPSTSLSSDSSLSLSPPTSPRGFPSGPPLSAMLHAV